MAQHTTGELRPLNAAPQVLPLRRQADVICRILKERLQTILPMAMRETDFDMWLILCHEDDLDPVYTKMIPMDTWCPILQVLVFHDRGAGMGVEGINISGTNTHDLYGRPYRGQVEKEQSQLLRAIVEEETHDASASTLARFNGQLAASHTTCARS